MAANRSQTLLEATKSVWARGGVAGLYQGLIPWVSACLVHSIRADLMNRHGLKLPPKVVCFYSRLLKSRLPVLAWVLAPLPLVSWVVWAAVSLRLMQLWVSHGNSTLFVHDAFFFLWRLVHNTVLPQINHLSGLTCTRLLRM
jgi:hypothetical protein